MSEDDKTVPNDDQPEQPTAPEGPVSNPDELLGKSMGQFQVVEEIGRGGMATVYRAVQQSMNRTVAVKVLPRNLLHDPGFYDRFVREVEVISHLEHPHILPIYDYGQSEGLPFIAMRYLGGGSLEQRIKKGIMDVKEIEKPLRQIAQALDYAHQQGIIHRDLKPGNIMLDESGNAYLSDFGIARVLGSDMTGSMIIGTPAYMSPEQANGMPIDARSDIYALGIVLFELLTGRGPFQAETPMAVLLKHITEPVPLLSDYRNDVASVVEDVIKKSTQKDPDDRFSSAGAMAEAYSRALRDEPTDLYPPLNVDSLKGSDASAATDSMQEQRTEVPANAAAASAALVGAPVDTTASVGAATGQIQPVSRRPSLMIFLLFVVVLIGGGAAAALVLSSQDDTPSIDLNAVPTPFPRASTIGSVDGPYTISMPNEWVPPQEYLDLSQGPRLRHLWQSDNGTVYIALNIFQAREAGGNPANRFRDFIESAYGNRISSEAFIDEAVAEDGTIRRSFRLPPGQNTGPDVPRELRNIERPGQLDLYFSQRGDRVVILEMYTADMFTSTLTSNDLVPQLQLILDSLRINSGRGGPGA